MSESTITIEIDSDEKMVMGWALRYWIANVGYIDRDRLLLKAREVLVKIGE